MPCSICHDKGLLPFVKGGRTIPNAWERCECYQEPIDHYHEITPSDFDFPVSWDMHRWICATYGKGDPGPEVPSPLKGVPPIIELDCQDCHTSKDVKQLSGNLINLRDILKQHVTETRPKRFRGEY